MKSIFTLTLVALLVVVATATTCTDIHDSATCTASSQDGEACVWCVCHAVPSSCVTASQAKKLPPSIFNCSSPSVVRASSFSCLTVKDEQTCSTSSEENGRCVWCQSKAVPSTCVNEHQAAHLPPSVFKCNASVVVAGAMSAYRPRVAMPIGSYPVGRTPSQQIFIGLAEGLADAILPDLALCILDADNVYSDFKSFATHLHLSVSDVKTALHDLGEGLKYFDASMSNCHVAEISKKVAEFTAKVTSIFGDIEVATEIVVNGINIYEDLSGAVHAWEDANYLQVGYKVADAIVAVL